MDLQRRARSCILNSINKRKERKKERKSSNKMNLAWTLQGQIYICYQIAVDFDRHLLIVSLNVHVFWDIVLCKLVNTVFARVICALFFYFGCLKIGVRKICGFFCGGLDLGFILAF